MNYKTLIAHCTTICKAYIYYFYRAERNFTYLYLLFSISEKNYEEV